MRWLFVVWVLVCHGVFGAIDGRCVRVIIFSDPAFTAKLISSLDVFESSLGTHRPRHADDFEKLSLAENYRALRDLAVRHVEYDEMIEAEPSLAPDARLEQEAILQAMTGAAPELKGRLLRRLDPGPSQGRGVILQLHAPSNAITGQYFLGKLLRTYWNWAQKKRLGLEVLEQVAGEGSESRDVTIRLTGNNAYETFRHEAGGHLFVGNTRERGNSQGRIHRNRVDVVVYPELEALNEAAIPESEFEIRTTTAKGPGGQHVNKTESMVVVKHIKTGITASIQDERSQHQNRKTALLLARTRVFIRQQADQREDLLKAKRAQLGMGNHSDAVRTYNEIDDRVTDRRTGDKLTLSDFFEEPLSDDYLIRLDDHRLTEMVLSTSVIP